MTNRAFSDLLAFRIVDKQHSMLLKRKTEHGTESTTERKRDIYISPINQLKKGGK